MAKSTSKRPTDAELEILAILWERGPSTVREVYRTFGEEKGVGYTTVLKLMQIMTDKGFLVRDESVRPQMYRPVKSQSNTQRVILRHVLDRAFDGSPGNLVLQALSSNKTTPEERRKIRELLDELERKRS